MKFVLLLSAFAIIFTEGFSQDSVRIQQRELDSLSLRIQSHAEKDSVRVKILNEYAQRCFYNLDFLNGLKAANEARALSRQLNFEKGQGLYFKSMAIFHRSHYAMAMYYLVQSNWILRQHTHFGPFLAVAIPPGLRDRESETTKTNLGAALVYFNYTKEKETLAHIHYALGDSISPDLLQLKTDQRSIEHQDIARDLFIELNVNFPALIILASRIQNFLLLGKDDEARELEVKAANLYSREKNKRIQALDGLLLGYAYGVSFRTYLALEYLFNAEEVLKESAEKDLLRSVYWNIAALFHSNEEKRLEYSNKGLDLFKEIGYYAGVEHFYLRIIRALISLKRIEQINPAHWSNLDTIATGRHPWFDSNLMRVKAEMLISQNKRQEALQILRESVRILTARNNTRGASIAAYDLASYYREIGNLDSAIEYGLFANQMAARTSFLTLQINVTDLLGQCYEESGKKEKAFEYLKLNKSFNEKSEKFGDEASISDLEVQTVLKKNQREIDLLQKDTQLKEQENKTQRLWIVSVSGAFLSTVFIAFILIRNNRQKQRANTVLESTLSNLRSTQSQLIQSEKMASLGELTAGIAHEIQNPLNFVNNFSEVNKELIGDMKVEIQRGNYDEVKALAEDIEVNHEKINHHGKRADAIVKGMLQHSRISNGVKEPTDINVLADEYLSLAYHGFRAKDKSFNAKFETDFDATVEAINVVPQEIGRVILNLINNAFYAVAEKQKQAADGYEPSVTVSTKNSGTSILISVKDNGNGIPQKVLDKIFQPFFTTKPTGQGTGLGLSLSYDLVKAQGGDLTVETREGEGSEFVVSLPL